MAKKRCAKQNKIQHLTRVFFSSDFYFIYIKSLAMLSNQSDIGHLLNESLNT